MIKSIPTSRGSVVIREATLADIVQYRALRLEALQDSPTAFSADYEATLHQTTAYWEDRLRTDNKGVILIAEHNGKLIGMAGIRCGQSPKIQHSADIWGVYVSPEWRGLRIAESLIRMCIEWAGMREVKIVKLGVMSTNESAIRCYKRCGFTIYGTEPQAMYYEGRYYEAVLMSRKL